MNVALIVVCSYLNFDATYFLALKSIDILADRKPRSQTLPRSLAASIRGLWHSCNRPGLRSYECVRVYAGSRSDEIKRRI